MSNTAVPKKPDPAPKRNYFQGSVRMLARFAESTFSRGSRLSSGGCWLSLCPRTREVPYPKDGDQQGE